MPMAMMYPSRPQTMSNESTATSRTTSTSSWYQGDISSRRTSINSNSFAPSEPIVKRIATVQEVSYNEPTQGFLIIESDSEDDDYDEVEINLQSNDVIPSSTEEYLYNAAPDSLVSKRIKPLPQIPAHTPEMQYAPLMNRQEEASPITPTKMIGETPFLMVSTQLETIQESLDSAIEEELCSKHEEEIESDDDNEFDPIAEEYDDEVKDALPVAVTASYDEKTTTGEEEYSDEDDYEPVVDDGNVALPPTIAMPMTMSTNNNQTTSMASTPQSRKPFEPNSTTSTSTASPMAHMQIPHTTSEAAMPPTVWSVDNGDTDNDSDDHGVLRWRVSKEELQPQQPNSASNISLCSISSASTSVLSNNDLLRAATTASADVAHPLPQSFSADSLHTHSSAGTPGYDHHQSLVPRSPLFPAPPVPVPASTSASASASAPETVVTSVASPHPLLQPIPVKSRLSIASFSLTHDKGAIKTYRRMARKLNDTDFQMTYAKYLVDVARLYHESKTYHATRERLLSEASYWIERLAKKGVPEALFIKAKWHLRPEHEDCAESYRNKPQPAKVLKCLQLAADMGWVEAHYELARLQKSRGEYAQAVEGFKQAAARGHTLATYKMAKILLRGQLQQSQDIKLGLEYLHKAADAADPNSAEPAYVLSCVYADELEHIGIARDSTMSRKNLPLAMQYLLKAAEGGLPMAVHRMGQVHEHGLLGQPHDPWLGYSFYLRAAEDGHEGAMLDLSRIYAQGIPGYLMHQHKVAFKWCQRAAAKGLQEAEYVLGTYYEDGVGTRPDYPLALKCYSKAASKGYTPAAEKLNLPTTSSLAEAADTANEKYQSTANRLSSVRIKKQPAAEWPIDDEPTMDSTKGTDQAPACHIM